MGFSIRAALLSVVLLASTSAEARESIRVLAHEIEPCVMVSSQGHFGGFEVDVLREIAKRLGADLEFRRARGLQGLFDGIEKGEADVGVAGVTITGEREQRFDFSHPTLDSGYSILVRKQVGSSFVSDMWTFITQPHLITLFGLFMLFLVICGHVAWLSERGTDSISDRYFPGIFEGLWFVWVTSTTVGYGDITPRKPAGRIAASVIMLIGIAFAGIVISELSSFRVADKLQSSITGANDLAGKRVATKAGSSSVHVLEALRARVAPQPSIARAYRSLLAGRVKAVVFDTPALRYYAEHDGRDKVMIVGPPFRRQPYGFVFQQSSPWREKFNTALLAMIEDGTYGRMFRRYFGGHS